MTDSAHTLKSPFRDAMASCAAGVHVITTDGQSGRYGITMTAVAPITDEPPTVMLCINGRQASFPYCRQTETSVSTPCQKISKTSPNTSQDSPTFPPKNASNTTFGIEGKPVNSKLKAHWPIYTVTLSINTKSAHISSFMSASMKSPLSTPTTRRYCISADNSNHWPKHKVV